MCAEAVKGVVGETFPLARRIEDVRAVYVPSADVGQTAQCVVGSTDQISPPLRTRVKANLADHIDDFGAFAQHNSIVTVEPACPIGLICLGKDGGVGAALGEHKDIPISNGAGKIDGQPGAGAAVKKHLNVIRLGG